MDEAYSIKNKAIIDNAISFSAMNRVFEQGSKKKIADKLEWSLGLLAGVGNKTDFEKIHTEFCEWFVQNIFTAKNVLKNKKIKKSRTASLCLAAAE